MMSYFMLVLSITIFFENPLYKEIPKKIMFIPFREGLREIKEIILTPLDEKKIYIK